VPTGEGRAAHRLRLINSWTPAIAYRKFLECCGSRRWAEAMAAARPLASIEETAAQIWKGCTREDILEAFAAHPKIGDHKGASEQSAVRTASEATLRELARLNREYEARFGYLFIVCATGKTGEEMLALLRERLRNQPEEEIAIAAAEQRLITQLRLKRL
jgi:OHCU decarboxylase